MAYRGVRPLGMMYGERRPHKGFAVRLFELLNETENEQGGIKDATASISGEGVYGALKEESGVHRVQRVPSTESLGRVHTSTAVVIVPLISSVLIMDVV